MRKTKLNQKTKEKIVEAIRDGNTNLIAAKLAGISESTFYNWINKGRESEKGVYRQLVDEIEQAEAEAIAQAVGEVKKAMKEDWKAAGWYLERRDPANWGRKDRVTAELSGTVKTDHEASQQADFEKQIENDPVLQELYMQIWERQQALNNGNS